MFDSIKMLYEVHARINNIDNYCTEEYYNFLNFFIKIIHQHSISIFYT